MEYMAGGSVADLVCQLTSLPIVVRILGIRKYSSVWRYLVLFLCPPDATYNPQKKSLLCSFSLVIRWMKHQSLVSHVICFMLLNICIVRERSTETSKVLFVFIMSSGFM